MERKREDNNKIRLIENFLYVSFKNWKIWLNKKRLTSSRVRYDEIDHQSNVFCTSICKGLNAYL